MKLREQSEHHERQPVHGHQRNDAGGIGMREFEHAETEDIDRTMDGVQPDNACVAENVEHVNQRQGQQQRAHATLPRHVEHGDGPNEDDHGLQGRAGQNDVDTHRGTVRPDEIRLDGVFTKWLAAIEK